MAQHDYDIANGSGSAVRADINNALAAIRTTNSGTSRPSSIVAGQMWLDTDTPSSTQWTLNIFDGAEDIRLGIVDTTDNAFSPAQSSSGLRNLIDNANPLVNQRGYVSGSAVGGANTYTLDRWRVVTSGQALSWSDSAGVRTLTAPAGGVEQVIEGARIAAGTYTLSWTGTAAATVNGNAVSSGGAVTLSGGANCTVRFSNGTVALPQLEPGRVPTPFEWRHVALDRLLCQRYFYVTERAIRVGGTMLSGIGASTFVPLFFPVRMRVAPTASGIAFGFGTGNASQAVESIGPDGAEIRLTANGGGGGVFIVTLSAGASFSAEF